MKRLLVFLTCAFLCLLTACDTSSKEKVPATSTAVEAVKETSPVGQLEASPQNATSSIESDIQFIREKYAIINKGANYQTVPIELKCDERTFVNLERKYNEAGALSYLQLHVCGEHGCMVKHHYYWEGELIFLFHENDFTPGSNHIIEEHRTYFKEGQMIRCLEKKVHQHEGTAPMAELLKKATSEEVDCTEDKRTEKLSELENLSVAEAKNYFCGS